MVDRTPDDRWTDRSNQAEAVVTPTDGFGSSGGWAQPGREKALTLFGRALRLRCPFCGGGGIFESWLTMKKRCPTCGLGFERGESGYELGSIALNLIIAEGLWAILFVATLVLTWPTPPWQLLQWGSIALMVALPILMFPFTRTLALALDILFRPVKRHELRPLPEDHR
jgi:uncharacterized protein (DUF983 family)